MAHGLVTIEGIDGSGKGTVTDSLKDEFTDAVFTTEPNRDNWVGQAVQRALEGDDTPPLTDFHLFMADHHKHVSDVIHPAFEDGRMVICDRYLDSRYAYQQMSLDGVVDNVEGWLREVQEVDASVMPDLTLLLDVSVEESFRRKAGDEKEKFEKREFLEGVRENYFELAELFDERYVIIDGEQEPEEVVEDCITAIENNV